MSTIAVLTSNENGANSLSDINLNFLNINSDKVEKSNPYFTSMTAGSIPFIGTGGIVTEDNTNLFWDNTRKQFRIGLTGAPFDNDQRVRLQVVGNINDYSDVAAQNKNAGDSATTDFFTSADNDSSTLIGHYTDFGITSSGWNPSTAGNIKTVSVNAAGTGYAVGNVLTVSTGGDGNGQVTVATIGGSGNITSVTLNNNGTGYVIGSGYSTTGGAGSGCTINVLSIIDFTFWAANDGYIFNSGGNFNISTDTLGKVVKISIGGIGTLNEVARFTSSGMTIGLTGTTLGKIVFSGNTSTSITLQGQAAGLSSVLTLPTGTDTLAGKATTDIFTNKTYDTAGTGNVFKINGTQITANTGTGSNVLATSPTLITPVLGVATATSINGNTFTTGTYTITGQAGKTFTFNGSITLTGTDAQTYTFPTTSATLARTDAANTFTGHQTIEGITSTGATGTGNLVFSISPTFTGSPIVPTQAANDASTKIATTAYVDSTQTDNFIKGIQALGSVIKAQSIGMNVTEIANTFTLSNGLAEFIAVYIPKTQTITGVKWYQKTTGSYTASNNNYVALYSYSAGTLTQVAISTNDGNIWKASANAYSSAAFTGTYNAVPGIYFVGFLYCRSAETTAPQLGSTTNFVNSLGTTSVASIDLTNSAVICGFISAQTTLPSTQVMSGLTSVGGLTWFGLY